MKIIDDLIKQYDSVMVNDFDLHTQAKLKMINALLDEIQDSKDYAYMAEIVSQFAKIIEDQQDIIGSQLVEIAKADGYGPMDNYVSCIPSAEYAHPSAPKAGGAKELHSYLPPEGGFKTDEQVKKAFTNYLTYHVDRKTKAGKDKPFSIHTIYDYSSRLKVLWEIVQREYQTTNRDNALQLEEQNIIDGCTFLNAYNNIDALRRYVELKLTKAQEIAMGLREPALADEAQKNPLNNPRNLANTSAALMKFEEFKLSVENAESIK